MLKGLGTVVSNTLFILLQLTEHHIQASCLRLDDNVGIKSPEVSQRSIAPILIQSSRVQGSNPQTRCVEIVYDNVKHTVIKK